jgi:hypothetical protein
VNLPIASASISLTLSRVENDRLDDEQTPREETLQRIAKCAPRTDPDELLLLARRIPDAYRDRILSKPGVFRKLLNLSDTALEELIRPNRASQAVLHRLAEISGKLLKSLSPAGFNSGIARRRSKMSVTVAGSALRETP